GRRDEARRQLALALPDAPRAHYTLGVLLFEERRWGEAVPEFRRFGERLPDIFAGISPRRHIGVAFAAHGRRRGGGRRDHGAAARCLLGNALKGQRLFDEALAQYRLCLQVHPMDVAALNGAAIALGATGRLEEAIELFRRAAAAEPDDGALQRNLANVLVDAGRPVEAVEPARRAVALRPDDAEAHDLLGRGRLPAGEWGG